MGGIGMTELLLVGIVALIVVGPKDLPGMFRTLGQFTGKMRGMAREFQRAMEDAADESGVKSISKDLKGLSNPKKYGLDKLSEAARDAAKWEPDTAPKGPKAAGPETEKLRSAQAERKEGTKEFVAKLAADREAQRARLQSGPAKETGRAADTPLTRTGTDT